MESANKLERLVNEKYEGPHSSKWASAIRHVLLELAQVIQAYDTVIVRTMKLNLHPQWEEAIDTFVAAYNTFATSFTKLFPRYRSDELMTPKIAYIQYEVKRWIKKFDVSLLRIVEQAFEGVHYVFLAKEKHYSIPRTGAELLAGERRFTSDPSFDRKRKGRIVIQATKKRKQAVKTMHPYHQRAQAMSPSVEPQKSRTNTMSQTRVRRIFSLRASYWCELLRHSMHRTF